jgi:hypothetical protein
MKHSDLSITATYTEVGSDALTDAELKELGAALIKRHGCRCQRVLAVLPTDVPDIWQVSCMQDGAMDALVTFLMDVRTRSIVDA